MYWSYAPKDTSFHGNIIHFRSEVGGIMLPLIDFPVFEDTLTNPEYNFTNPLAMDLLL